MPHTSSPKSYPAPIDDLYMHRNSHWDFSTHPKSPPSTSPPQTLSPATFTETPRPMAALDAPITLVDFTRKINHHLLRSCAALAKHRPDEALKEADFTLYLAEARKIYHLQSKSQYYRGLCLMGLEQWQEASQAFTKAASVRWWAARVALLKAEAERRIEAEEKRGSPIRHGHGEIVRYL